MIKRHRELANMALCAGLTLESITPGKNGHTRVIARAQNGVEKTFYFASSPGDRRGDKNGESLLRRFARENQVAGRTPPVGQIGDAIIRATKAIEEHGTPAAEPKPQEPPMVEKEEPVSTTNKEQEKPRATRQVTNLVDFYQVCEAVKNIDLTGVYTMAEAVRRAQAKTTVRVTEYSTASAMKALGLKLEKPPARRQASSSDVAYLAGLMVDHFTDLGVEVPERLAKLAGD